MPAARTTPLQISDKPYNRPARRESKPKYSELGNDQDMESDRETTPPLSSASEDHDRSSDFAQTPSPTPARKRKGKVTSYQRAMHDDDDDEEYDIDLKPDVDDDEISYPGIVSDPYDSEEAEEYYDKNRQKPVKGKGKAGKPSTPKKKKASLSVGGSGKKPGLAWIPEEDWMMFQCLHPKVEKPNWAAVAAVTGRDAKVSRVLFGRLS